MLEHSDRDDSVESFLHVSVVLQEKLKAALPGRAEAGNSQKRQLVRLQVDGLRMIYLLFRNRNRRYVNA